MSHYDSAFKNPSWLIQYRLNHPPEDAFSLIRDQTRSNYLEEFVHPLRESLFVSGFEPTKPSQQININGVHYKSKVTVKLIPSTVSVRLTIFSLVIIAGIILTKHYVREA
jgi:hypothetical protein